MCLLKEPLVVTIAGRENQYCIRRKIPLMHTEHLALKKTFLLYNETAKRTNAMNTSQDKNVTSKIHKIHPKQTMDFGVNCHVIVGVDPPITRGLMAGQAFFQSTRLELYNSFQSKGIFGTVSGKIIRNFFFCCNSESWIGLIIEVK